MQGYLAGLPRAVLKGGRYDPLIEQFTPGAKAVGFALYLDELERLSAPTPENGDGGRVMIAIVDYGVGNLFSLSSSLRALGVESEVTRSAQRLRAAERIILPGVGAFGDAKQKLDDTGLVPVLREEAEHKPLLGICLGMQLLFDRGFEYGEHTGLGLIPGEVADLRGDLTDQTLKVPHMIWTKHNPIPVFPSCWPG